MDRRKNEVNAYGMNAMGCGIRSSVSEAEGAEWGNSVGKPEDGNNKPNPKKLAIPIGISAGLELFQKIFLGNYPTAQFIISLVTSAVCIGCLILLCSNKGEKNG